jgi:hypothetical protein
VNPVNLESLITAYRAGQQAQLQLAQRARKVFRTIQRFNLNAVNDIRRIRSYRSEYLCEHGIDQLPPDPIFAGTQWSRADIEANGVSIVSSEYMGDEEYDYHTFTLPFTALWQTDDEIEATLRANLTRYLSEVAQHEERKAREAEEEARQRYEELKARFEPLTPDKLQE